MVEMPDWQERINLKKRYNMKIEKDHCVFIAAVLLIGGLIGMFIYCYPIICCENSENLKYVIGFLSVFFMLTAIVASAIGLLIAHNHIFPGSGDPKSMANSLYQSLFLQSQTILAILLVAVITLLIVGKILTPSEGLPIITGATGFALGKTFIGKETNNKEESKNNKIG